MRRNRERQSQSTHGEELKAMGQSANSVEAEGPNFSNNVDAAFGRHERIEPEHKSHHENWGNLLKKKKRASSSNRVTEKSDPVNLSLKLSAACFLALAVVGLILAAALHGFAIPILATAGVCVALAGIAALLTKEVRSHIREKIAKWEAKQNEAMQHNTRYYDCMKKLAQGWDKQKQKRENPTSLAKPNPRAAVSQPLQNPLNEGEGGRGNGLGH